MDLTVGQFRLPFGIWSDYTSHRNFSSTKNNYLVNGFALKKIELGILVEKSFASGVGLKAALVHGRQGRTAPLHREDHDNKKVSSDAWAIPADVSVWAFPLISPNFPLTGMLLLAWIGWCRAIDYHCLVKWFFRRTMTSMPPSQPPWLVISNMKARL